ncbi:phospho-sugar mutase [Tenuibacillus multivorans]|uniref:Phosphoglucomutase n=1 Tax=Tenuibacillus multivorans TaxID=237069 RepID=A0A1H0BSK5_9BACI|nr:phospho-sugar mutase [Tenuibacillus multivorans]GEL77050.1 phosphoglucomutase [Tenuibacillus multivorans]SDN48638.1 phosphoglucomutase [Tenuibacillus multivorans]
MSWEEHFNRWNQFDQLDIKLQEQLTDLYNDEEKLKEAFHQYLTFGTGGMRGIIGPGTNRMNIYTVRKAAKGLATYLEEQGSGFKYRGVVVAYDSRYMSLDFALETAKVLGKHDIPTYIFSSLRPTPVLSFAVRHLGTAAGVMITASHNPPEYNGYKVYNEAGGQLPPGQADDLIEKVNAVEDELSIPVLEQHELEDEDLLRWIDDRVDEAYLDELENVALNRDVVKEQADNLNIVFTSLHGTANELMQTGLKEAGFNQVHVVEEQAEPDPEFSTVASPNPEEHQAFELAIRKGFDVGADVLVATDPDADRLGVAALNGEGEYQVLTGNQLGALMLDYILTHQSEIPDNAVMIKTIVTSELGKAVANDYGIETMNVLTGFKFIGEKIEEFSQTGEREFVFGYEESYGYLVKDFSRDKDALQSTVLASEMAAYYKSQGKTLFDALGELYERHGYYLEDLHSIKLEGLDGAEQINSIMEDFRENPVDSVEDLSVEAVEDYKAGTRTYVVSGEEESIDLPASNVVKFILSEGCWCCLRPSGTEPKIKFYFGVKGKTREEAESRLQQLKGSVLKRIDTQIIS